MGTRFPRAAIGIVAVALVVACSSPARGQTPVGDSVVGGIVELGEPPARIAGAQIDVHSGPSGESPTGTAGWGAGGAGDFSTASVITCLVVTDRTAIVGFSGTHTFGSFEFPIAGLLRVVDGGGPNSGQDTFEWAEIGSPFDPPIPGPTDCSQYPSSFPRVFTPPVVNVEGDLVVTDVRPVPTSKVQCENGGWHNFAGFKNQGDCVSFVASGGKNPPAGP
jgi:hypothetical protein